MLIWYQSQLFPNLAADLTSAAAADPSGRSPKPRSPPPQVTLSPPPRHEPRSPPPQVTLSPPPRHEPKTLDTKTQPSCRSPSCRCHQNPRPKTYKPKTSPPQSHLPPPLTNPTTQWRPRPRPLRWDLLPRHSELRPRRSSSVETFCSGKHWCCLLSVALR